MGPDSLSGPCDRAKSSRQKHRKVHLSGEKLPHTGLITETDCPGSCGVFFPGDNQNLPGHNPVKTALGKPALGEVGCMRRSPELLSNPSYSVIL